MKNKLFKGLALLALLSSTATGVFAQEAPNSVTFKKEYVVNGGTAPAEDFKFSITAVGVTDSTFTGDLPMPTIDGPISFGAISETTTFGGKIILPTYSAVGIYTYELKETKGNTAGVTYADNTAYLKVYVTQDGDNLKSTAVIVPEENPTDVNSSKTDTPFTNTYEAGSLKVKKVVEGNLGERDRKFPITITLTAPAGLTVNSTIKVDGVDKAISFVDGKATIKDLTIKHDQTITFDNLPKETKYTIQEDKPVGYDEPVISNTGGGSIENTETDEETITNTKNQLIPTGVLLENLPYVILLVLALAGLGFYFFKKHQNNQLD